MSETFTKTYKIIDISDIEPIEKVKVKFYDILEPNQAIQHQIRNINTLLNYTFLSFDHENKIAYCKKRNNSN